LINPNYRWCDVAIGGVNRRNNIVDIFSFKVPEGKTDCFRTVYRYPDEFKKHFEANKTVAGYSGPVYADFFPIDIDDEDLGKAHETARRVLDRLAVNYDVDLQCLRCYFSGAKGFHIMIPARMFGCYASPKLPAAFKAMAAEILEGIKYDSSIYDAVRLFRLTNTKNSKTGLYKIPLYPAELLHSTTEQILEWAREPRKIELVNECDKNEALSDLFAKCMQQVQERQKQSRLSSGVVTAPPNSKLCYYRIMNGVEQGNRDNCALRLAVYWHKQGLPGDMIYNLLLAWNKRNTPPLDDDDIAKAVRQAENNPYDFGCNDEVLKAYCDARCYLKNKARSERVGLHKIYDLATARKKYEEYVRELEKRKITLGISVIDRAIRGIAPGELCQVLARSGVGKTAFLLNVIRHLSPKGIPILLFSLEMPVAQIFERCCQIANAKEGWEIEQAFKKQSEEVENLSYTAMLNYGNMLTVDEDYLTYEEMCQFIELSKTYLGGQKPSLVCIDYLGRMKGGYGSHYEVISEIVKQLKRMAKEMDVAVLFLNQTNRAGKTGAEPVTMDMARDTGQAEEASDFVIGLWRPEIDKPEAQKSDTEELRVAVLKNRKGALCQIPLIFNKKHLTIYEPEDAPLVAQEIEYDQDDLPF
jgi:KaiC/GvpD/RAD55 family RecA-like ATPase